ncbi:hypothetical protein [[Limnothrix rosea] IAM M-220]|uniref:hypothetical protein n=1 Tax=[Limnothrix rosea] IAM M-220 TaxID=454133 RepID=UPI000962246B|nr:hypothetical protein [[Limnothrix rosea] IAM M-220]OKH16837.1 hypothetical protein NIES208_11600 [[Limnothrix rosea] IAM M-220]
MSAKFLSITDVTKNFSHSYPLEKAGANLVLMPFRDAAVEAAWVLNDHLLKSISPQKAQKVNSAQQEHFKGLQS